MDGDNATVLALLSYSGFKRSMKITSRGEVHLRSTKLDETTTTSELFCLRKTETLKRGLFRAWGDRRAITPHELQLPCGIRWENRRWARSPYQSNWNQKVFSGFAGIASFVKNSAGMKTGLSATAHRLPTNVNWQSLRRIKRALYLDIQSNSKESSCLYLKRSALVWFMIWKRTLTTELVTATLVYQLIKCTMN